MVVQMLGKMKKFKSNSFLQIQQATFISAMRAVHLSAIHLCNVLDFAGYDVAREYYINDAGNQVDNLAKSVEARYFQALGLEKEMPEDGYQGQDIIEIGEELVEEFGDKYDNVPEEERYAFFREYGLEL